MLEITAYAADYRLCV